MTYNRSYKYYRKKKFSQKRLDLYSGPLYYNHFSEFETEIERIKKEITAKEELLLFLQNFKITGIQKIKFKKFILSDSDHYKKGIKYFFKKELKDNFQKRINSIDKDLNEGKDMVDGELSRSLDIYNVKWFEEEINDLINNVSLKIQNYKKDVEILNKNYSSKKERLLRKQEIEQERIEKEKRRNEKEERIKALAFQNKEKSRQLASSIKNKVEKNNLCPYCGSEIIEAHVDHIYPISKGGLSTKCNMVMVCSKCNMQKKRFNFKSVY